jgi:hypothetical protein
VVACAGSEGAARRRAILVSFDAFNPIRFEQTLDSATIPAFTRLFREGRCAPYVLTQWATQTPMAHAAIWTGAFAHVNGVGRQEAALPESEWSWLDPRPPASLYFAGHLAAEPLWITAGRQGLTVFAHHPTHAPQPPAYRRLETTTNDATIEALRAEAEAVLALPGVRVMNGYNERHGPRVIRPSSHPPRPAEGWSGLPASASPPLELAWDAGADSLYALITGDTAYTEMWIATTRDAAAAVRVRPSPARIDAAPGDTAAPHFSAPLIMRSGTTPVAVAFRLFELSPDARSFLLYQTYGEVVQSNRATLTDEYVAATGGWIGNAYVPGLGAMLGEGGDGATEDMQLDVHAYLVRQWTRGTRWAWSLDPDLLIDYNSAADSYDHDWYGWLAEAAPQYDPDVAARVREVRSRGYALLDRHMELLLELASADPNTLLFVTSDHGMRPVWRTAHPNAILARAGLLAVTDTGTIDLGNTRALSPDGWGIVVNRASRKDGIVEAGDEAEVVAAARRALVRARGPDGQPIVERIYAQAELDSLFGAGPSANSLYISWVRGVRGNASIRPGPDGAPAATTEMPTPRGDHGATLPYEEGLAGFCVFGEGVAPGSLPVMRQTDIAPTVADWLGIGAPRHATGRSLLGAVLGRGGAENRRE